MVTLAATPSAAAQELTWDALQKEHRVSAGVVLPPDSGASFHRLKVEGTGQAAALTVLTIEPPGVKGPRYAVTGQVRYDGVEGVGFLELWNYFPGGGQYFSRTLGDSGPMMKLSGTSGWRSFTLPFDATGAPPPTKLVVNVVLPGRGVVFLGPLTLRDVEGSSQQTIGEAAGVLGGFSGALVGVLGALIGILTARGRARRFVDITSRAMIVVGVVAFAIGLLATVRSAPYAVYFPLLLIGFLSAVVPLGLLPTIRKRYEDIESRRMRAHDLG